ncbi:hypothetical protein BDZ45DRAFT_682447 [Acephala macrosclerotiorum]|nr:hypothetical protein BDZ45DRAFT_682447 [Acephala macrosclerotiorum]
MANVLLRKQIAHGSNPDGTGGDNPLMVGAARYHTTKYWRSHTPKKAYSRLLCKKK